MAKNFLRTKRYDHVIVAWDLVKTSVTPKTLYRDKKESSGRKRMSWLNMGNYGNIIVAWTQIRE
jgi:hypothetical protein